MTKIIVSPSWTLLLMGFALWTGILLALSVWVIQLAPSPYVTRAEMRKETTGIVNMLSRVECKLSGGKHDYCDSSGVLHTIIRADLVGITQGV